MRLERLPGNEGLVGRWSEDEHQSALADPGTAYLIGLEDERPRAFAIIRALDNPHGNVLLMRIVVEGAGQGFGRKFLAGGLSWMFGHPPTHRVWLTVFEHNARAQHVYRSLGFSQEGKLCEAFRRPDGGRATQHLMSILRPEWEAQRHRGAAVRASAEP